VLLLLLLVPAYIVLQVPGAALDGVRIALSWRLLLLHGGHSRKLVLPGTEGGAGAQPVVDSPAPSPAATPAASAAQPAQSAPPSPRSGRRAGWSARIADLERAVELVRRLVAHRALRVMRLDGWVEFALDDVGDTGRAFGMACAVAAVLDPHGRLELRPRWDASARLAVDLLLEVRLHPLRALLVLLAQRLRGARVARPAVSAGETLAA